jgi:hypothetical protein
VQPFELFRGACGSGTGWCHCSGRTARFTAETVIEALENTEEYRAFEDATVSEYLPQTPVEQELVHRLASLFWRLRRATSIETGVHSERSPVRETPV